MSKPRVNVAIFSGGSAPNKKHEVLAKKLGKGLAQIGVGIVNGGGGGLMESTAQSAYCAGGHVIGIHFDFEGREKSKHNTKTLSFSVLSKRQKKILELGDLFVVLPGGLGTLYEIIEVISLKYVSSLPKSKKVILVSKAFWKRFDAVIDFLIQEGYAKSEVKHLYQIVDSVEDAITIVKRYVAEK